MLDLDVKLVAAVLDDWKTAPLSARRRAGLALVEAMTLRPSEAMDALVAEARATGIDYAALEDAASVAFQFNLISRVADAFDFPVPTSAQLPRVARLLDRAKLVSSGSRPSPSWTRVAGGLVRSVEVHAGYEWMLEARCDASRELLPGGRGIHCSSARREPRGAGASQRQRPTS